MSAEAGSEMGNRAPAAEAAPAPRVEESKEPAGSAASGALVPVGIPIFTLFAFAALVAVVAGTPVTWISSRQEATTTTLTLWATTLSDHSAVPYTRRKVKVADLPCDVMRQRFRALEAFAILSIVSALATVAAGCAAWRRAERSFRALEAFAILSIVSAVATVAAGCAAWRRAERSSFVGGKVLAAATAVFTLITWAMAVGLYYKRDMCVKGNPSYADQKYELDAGLGVFVTAFGLVLIALGAAVANPTVPAAVPSSVVVRTLLLVLAAVQALAFVFAVIGTPTDWFFKWDASGTTSTRMSVWTQRVYVNGNRVGKGDLKDSQCGELPKFAQFGQAFAIISIVATLVGAAVAKHAASGAGSVGAALGAGLFALIATTCTFAAGLSLYFRQFCAAASLHAAKYHVTGGLVLFGCAMVLLLVTLLVVVVFQAIAADTVLFDKEVDALTSQRWTFWRRYDEVSGVVGERPVGCDALEQRLVGGGVLNAISIVIHGVALLLAAAQIANGSLRRAASFVALLASVLLLASWALVADVYNRGQCGQRSFAKMDFEIRYGFVLLFVGWAVALIGTVANLVVGGAQ
ncbi:amastin, putative [Bodo saltans]|uniref:Amastin, putative n=1 Tax=Bodo saltans TaxID=75058 RepID=A0A0S4JK45_BODSA|nr:amastin, putative [Bodo saltans]|eukprot:CUG90955.1 amastin, putative [Bodo saltans]